MLVSENDKIAYTNKNTNRAVGIAVDSCGQVWIGIKEKTLARQGFEDVYGQVCILIWWAHTDLNRGPRDYEFAAETLNLGKSSVYNRNQNK